MWKSQAVRHTFFANGGSGCCLWRQYPLPLEARGVATGGNIRCCQTTCKELEDRPVNVFAANLVKSVVGWHAPRADAHASNGGCYTRCHNLQCECHNLQCECHTAAMQMPRSHAFATHVAMVRNALVLRRLRCVTVAAWHFFCKIHIMSPLKVDSYINKTVPACSPRHGLDAGLLWAVRGGGGVVEVSEFTNILSNITKVVVCRQKTLE